MKVARCVASESKWLVVLNLFCLRPMSTDHSNPSGMFTLMVHMFVEDKQHSTCIDMSCKEGFSGQHNPQQMAGRVHGNPSTVAGVFGKVLGDARILCRLV